LSRPLIAIPARFSASAAALRYEAEVSARKLIEAVYAAGGKLLSVHPSAPGGAIAEAQAGKRLGFADGVLLPGGGDLSPVHYGGAAHESLYDMDTEQDAFDLAVARWCLNSGRRLPAICRGLQIVNVAMGRHAGPGHAEAPPPRPVGAGPAAGHRSARRAGPGPDRLNECGTLRKRTVFDGFHRSVAGSARRLVIGAAYRL